MPGKAMLYFPAMHPAAHERQHQEEQDRIFARTEGARAGRMRLPFSLNPYHHADPLFEEWRAGWQREAAELALADLRGNS